MEKESFFKCGGCKKIELFTENIVFISFLMVLVGRVKKVLFSHFCIQPPAKMVDEKNLDFRDFL